jgi:hypothetical protein
MKHGTVTAALNNLLTTGTAEAQPLYARIWTNITK